MYKCCFLSCFCASQRVQRRKAELTLAQILKKLPNGWADLHQIWHTCANSYGNGYTPNKLPIETQGGHLGVLGGPTIQQSGEAVRLVPTLIHVCGFICERTYAKYKSPHNTPGGISGVGGYRVSQIQKSREAVKWLDRLAPNLAHICRSIWEWIYDKQIAPRDTRGTWVG